MTEDVKDEVHLDEEGNIVEPPAPEQESQEDERVVAHEPSDDHDEEEAAGEETAEEAEARKERNRKRRIDSKTRRKEYVESLKNELAARDRVINEMNQRLSTVERKSSGSEMAQLENAEREAVMAYNQFKEVNAKAIEQANGRVAIDAQEKMFQARNRIQQIQSIKQAMNRKQQSPQPLDPRLVNHAQEWMKSNNWYDPRGTDEDSALTLTIDNRLAQEGWNPTTPEYWKELSNRVARVLPHRVKVGYNNPTGRNRSAPPPVAGSGRESNSSSKGTYKISSERVQALKEAGLWDDPKQRAEAIKRFQSYDKEQQA